MKRTYSATFLEVQGKEQQEITSLGILTNDLASSENEEAITVVTGSIQIFP